MLFAKQSRPCYRGKKDFRVLATIQPGKRGGKGRKLLREEGRSRGVVCSIFGHDCNFWFFSGSLLYKSQNYVWFGPFFWCVCVGCSVVYLVILSLSGQHPIFSQKSIWVGPPNFEDWKTGKQTRIFGGPTPIILWENIGCRPLKLKITKDTTLHPTQIRQKNGPDQT